MATSNTNLTYMNETSMVDGGPHDVDEKMDVVNPAAFGVWWELLNRDKWKIMIELIFQSVND